MELLVHTVIDYLEHNKRLVVPRLGTFIVKPDDGTVIFSELLRKDDGVLRSLLEAKGLGELEIEGMIDRTIFNIRHAVSGGKEYAFEGFGTFRAGANGTIRFTQTKAANIVHGYIKPAIPMSDQTDRREARSPISALYDASGEHRARMSRSHIANPDPYLRGLKYDKRKKSEREGAVYIMSGASQAKRHNMTIALIAALLVIGAVSYIFIRYHNNPPSEDVSVIERGYTDGYGELPAATAAVEAESDQADAANIGDAGLLTEEETDNAAEATAADTEHGNQPE